ncbi:MAG TPA: TonB-dependent receptor [Terriglobia bacterium]
MQFNSIRTVVMSLCLAGLLASSSAASAQVSAFISGAVSDASGGAVPGAKVTARNIETGAERTAMTDADGVYRFLVLPVGEYQIQAAKSGFNQAIRQGVHLAVGQQAVVDFALQVGNVEQQIRVTAEAPLVSTTTSDASGLVAEQQVKDLPLNGRSYDELMMLNPGVVNFTWEKTGGIGVSNSTTGNMFSVNGNRPQQNLFLLNGVEYSGAAENNMQPGGASQQLLGVDAVREVSIVRDTYSAEYGKHPGGQVTIVTQSGSNQWHGSAFEFLRNNALDAPNFFDLGSAPLFQRNQFGASGGGPLRKDRTFLFANYEGYRQNLHQTSVELVPDAQARLDAAPIVQQLGLLNLWPAAPANAPDLKVSGQDGVAEAFLSPQQTIHEDFGTARLDHIFSPKDSASAIYTVDNSGSVTATPFDAFFTDLLHLREQVLSLQETYVFSPSLINTGRLGFSRARYFFAGEPTPGTPAAAIPGFLAGLPVGAVVVGGSQASNPQAQLGLAGSNNGSNLHIARNLFTYTDQLSGTNSRHQWTAGAWFQRFQSNEEIALSQYGQMTFTGLPAFLTGTGSFLFDPSPAPLGWRSLFGAFFAEDVIRLRPNLTLSLGFRDEFSNGWNEAHGRASNYAFTNGVISSEPTVGSSLFTTNRAAFLPQPRVALAWSPLGPKTAIRAGFGVYNDLQDALGYRLDQNAPFNPTYTIAAGSIANLNLPFKPNAPPPSNALLVPGGVQPDLYMPTVESWSLKMSRQLSDSTSVTIGYVGSHGYHELVGVDANAPAPVICPASPCPATFPNLPVWGALAGQPVPAGTYFTPTATKPNPAIANTWTWFSEGASSYNALQLDVNHRFTRGLGIRGVYTWSKTLDDGDSLNATAAANAPGLISNPYHIKSDWGLATYDVRNLAVITAAYEIPFATGKPAGGWMLNSIVTAQSGFPFTPQLGFNPSNNGDTRNPVRPFVNPAFSGPVVLGNPNQWFDPNAFIAPPNNSGFYGNLGRNTFIGPGLSTWDMSLSKNTRFHETQNIQFRVEVFNMLNRANFNTPSLITHVLLPGSTNPTPSPAAGLITGTSTSSRQIQFALKWLF